MQDATRKATSLRLRTEDYERLVRLATRLQLSQSQLVSYALATLENGLNHSHLSVKEATVASILRETPETAYRTAAPPDSRR